MTISDKKSLKGHLEQIALCVLSGFGIEHFEVSIQEKVDSDISEPWFGNIVCKVSIDSELDNDIKDAFSLFIEKKVYRSNDRSIYWFEGERNVDEAIGDFSLNLNNDQLEVVDKLKMETRLPVWLDHYIYEEIACTYLPDFNQYATNVHHDDILVKNYLGTYFPRSFAESFCIFSDLIRNPYYADGLEDKDTISILSIGSGTGGDIIGTLQALRVNVPTNRHFSVYATDGNKKALAYLTKVVRRFEREQDCVIELQCIEEIWNDFDSLRRVLDQMELHDLDIVVSSKMVNELINTDVEDAAYFKIMECVMPLLSVKGVFLLLDVTTLTNTGEFVPTLMNTQVNQYLMQHQEYKTISPTCCAEYAGQCKIKCFTQLLFKVSHSKKRGDISKVVYRLFGKTTFVNELISTNKRGRAVIKWEHSDEKPRPSEYCFYSLQEQEIIDPYKLQV